MHIIAFVLDAPTIGRILDHIGEPTQPPAMLPARSPPQLAFGFDQAPATTDWPEMDQSARQGAGWEVTRWTVSRVMVPRARWRGGWGGVPARGASPLPGNGNTLKVAVDGGERVWEEQ